MLNSVLEMMNKMMLMHFCTGLGLGLGLGLGFRLELGFRLGLGGAEVH